MILKAEPRTIMRFVEDNYEALSQLYRVQLKNNLIAAADFEELTRHKGDIVRRRLSAFKIVRLIGDDYRLAEEVGAYLGFLMQEFKPLLPEQLRRYHTSIQDMYDLLKIRQNMDDKTRCLRLEHLYNEVHSFLDNVTNNTFTLLKRSQKLKVNRQQIGYAERVKEARSLIEHYIDPLNQIVNLNDEHSIASLLQNISREINLDRMSDYPPSVIERYEQLDNLLRQVNSRLQREGDIIRRELTPLIERIKRESEVLGGWLVFLDRPLLRIVPDFGSRHPITVFGNQTEADLRMYMEQFKHTRQSAAIELSSETALPQVQLLDRRIYREKLNDAMPIDDFFDWCIRVIETHEPARQERDLFELTSLLFSTNDNYELTFHGEQQSVELNQHQYILPLLSVALKKEATV